ncbi:MAG: M48 family metallopeptidase [Patescibacteria group bacterium]
MYSQITANKQRTVLLMTIFFALILGIGWFLGFYLGYGMEYFIFAIGFSVVSALISYYTGDKIALASTGAREIKKEDNPKIWRLVENLTITTGIPMPRVYIIPSQALNAFATGRDPKHASIALTTGIIEALENEELEGVIAHELSHVKNYDILVMTIVVVLVGTISLIANMFMHGRLLSGSKRKEGGEWIMIIGLILIILSPIVAQLIQLAISRRREYLADASGAMMTRHPEGLARALEKISGSKAPLTNASAATAHLFIANPFKAGFASNLFSTHPPIAERVRRLREIVI